MHTPTTTPGPTARLAQTSSRATRARTSTSAARSHAQDSKAPTSSNARAELGLARAITRRPVRVHGRHGAADVRLALAHRVSSRSADLPADQIGPDGAYVQHCAPDVSNIERRRRTEHDPSIGRVHTSSNTAPLPVTRGALYSAMLSFPSRHVLARVVRAQDGSHATDTIPCEIDSQHRRITFRELGAGRTDRVKPCASVLSRCQRDERNETVRALAVSKTASTLRRAQSVSKAAWNEETSGTKREPVESTMRVTASTNGEERREQRGREHYRERQRQRDAVRANR